MARRVPTPKSPVSSLTGASSSGSTSTIRSDFLPQSFRKTPSVNTSRLPQNMPFNSTFSYSSRTPFSGSMPRSINTFSSQRPPQFGSPRRPQSPYASSPRSRYAAGSSSAQEPAFVAPPSSPYSKYPQLMAARATRLKGRTISSRKPTVVTVSSTDPQANWMKTDAKHLLEQTEAREEEKKERQWKKLKEKLGIKSEKDNEIKDKKAADTEASKPSEDKAPKEQPSEKKVRDSNLDDISDSSDSESEEDDEAEKRRKEAAKAEEEEKKKSKVSFVRPKLFTEAFISNTIGLSRLVQDVKDSHIGADDGEELQFAIQLLDRISVWAHQLAPALSFTTFLAKLDQFHTNDQIREEVQRLEAEDGILAPQLREYVSRKRMNSYDEGDGFISGESSSSEGEGEFDSGDSTAEDDMALFGRTFGQGHREMKEIKKSEQAGEEKQPENAMTIDMILSGDGEDVQLPATLNDSPDEPAPSQQVTAPSESLTAGAEAAPSLPSSSSAAPSAPVATNRFAQAGQKMQAQKKEMERNELKRVRRIERHAERKVAAALQAVEERLEKEAEEARALTFPRLRRKTEKDVDDDED